MVIEKCYDYPFGYEFLFNYNLDNHYYIFCESSNWTHEVTLSGKHRVISYGVLMYSGEDLKEVVKTLRKLDALHSKIK